MNSPSFDRDVSDAVKRFQQRHGLNPTGILSQSTLRELNVPAEDRLDQLRTNRLRITELIGKTWGKRVVVVNIPSYELQALDRNQVQVYSRVVAGKPTTPTPEVTASIQAINLLPHWHVPQSIANRALIPLIKKDPGYLKREHLRVYSTSGQGVEIDPREINWWASQGERYVFRQDPGPQNALGLIRIDMPNRHIVYMHDTPLKKLFKYTSRPYSAGCVRVENIFALAEWLVKGDNKDWDLARIGATIKSGKPETIQLNQAVPVHFVYITAWAKSPTFVEFRDDIYNKDSRRLVISSNEGWTTSVEKVMP
jgi:murein L,D-transpeptidase YcbB/YkuD